MHYVKITHVIKLVLENFSIYLLLYIIFQLNRQIIDLTLITLKKRNARKMGL